MGDEGDDETGADEDGCRLEVHQAERELRGDHGEQRRQQRSLRAASLPRRQRHRGEVEIEHHVAAECGQQQTDTRHEDHEIDRDRIPQHAAARFGVHRRCRSRC